MKTVISIYLIILFMGPLVLIKGLAMDECMTRYNTNKATCTQLLWDGDHSKLRMSARK